MVSNFKIQRRVVLFVCMLALTGWATYAQQWVPNYKFTIQNEVQTSDHTLEFDLYLLNTMSYVTFELSTVQLAITLNPDILNGGTLTAETVAGSSDLVTAQQPGDITCDYSTSIPILKVTPNKALDKGQGTIISTLAPGTRIARVRLTNSVSFAQQPANLLFKLNGTPYSTAVQYTDQATGEAMSLPLSSTDVYSSTANPVLNSLPSVTFDSDDRMLNAMTGTLTGLGSPYVVDYGFVYGTNPSPTIADRYISKGGASATGSYTLTLPCLVAGTPYCVRAYATNSVGTVYSSKELSFIATDQTPGNLSYTTPNVFTKGKKITALFPTVTGTVTGYTISKELPAGLYFDPAVGGIYGTPIEISPATDYTITASNAEASTSTVVRITVNDVYPTGLTYNTPNVFVKGSAIQPLIPSIGGGAVVSYSVTPHLPAGLSINGTTGVISGIPTAVTADVQYVVTASNTGGGAQYGVHIAVTDAPPSGLSYATSAVLTKGMAATPLKPTVGGGVVSSYAITPSLPAGLFIDPSTGEIGGTPTVIAPATVYTVVASNAEGSVSANITIAVNDEAPAGLSYASPLAFAKGTAIASLVPTVGGGVATGYSISPPLPAGLSIDASTGIISGTPSVIAAGADYTVTATNSAGKATTTINLTVNDAAPFDLSYPTPCRFTRGSGIASLIPTVSGGAVTTYSVTPALPAGLSINATTGVISGIPSTTAVMTAYTVTASNASGSTSFVLSVVVNETAPTGLSYPTPNVFARGTAIAALTSTVSSTVTAYSIAPALPAGLSIDASTGIISGTPAVAATGCNYTVTASNAGGDATFTLNIAVNDIAPTGLKYQTPDAYTKGVAISPLVPTVNGGGVSNFGINPTLPPGLSIDALTGVIGGTPTAVSAATNYTVTATNTGGSAVFEVNITVNDIPPANLSYTTPVAFVQGKPITPLSPSVSGGAVIRYNITPSLPAGLSIDALTGIISGTPVIASSSSTYTVTATNSGGDALSNLNISVRDAAPSGLAYTTPHSYTKGMAIGSLIPAVSGGAVLCYSVSPSLPVGLSIDPVTGVISGTPAAVTPVAGYMVTASNASGSCTFTVEIGVNNTITITTPESTVAGCQSSDLALNYTLLSGVPVQYQLTFDDRAIRAGLNNIAYTALQSSTGGIITFSIPGGMPAGIYTGSLQLKDNAGGESASYPFKFTVNLSSDYIIAKFNDVIACADSSSRFVSFQWYKNGVKIDGADKRFYNDPSGLNGTYLLQVTTIEGDTFFSCPKTFNIAQKRVTVAPNPVQKNSAFTIRMIGFDEQELSSATLSVFNMQGVCVYKSATVTGTNTLQLTLPQAYVGRVTTSDGKAYSFKIVVRQ
jgi:uncharacterized repeat protein (TIGR01451 family)